MEITKLEKCIIDGTAFEISGTKAIAATTSSYIMGRVNSHLVSLHHFRIRTDRSPFTVELYESPTVTADGTPITPRNKNRNVADVASTLVFDTPTITADGTQLYILKESFSGTGVNAVGGEGDIPSEWVLKKNTDYIFKITNDEAVTALNASFSFVWCEG